jgi:hypothetical protein
MIIVSTPVWFFFLFGRGKVEDKLFGLDFEVVLALFDEDVIVVLVEDQSGKLGEPGEDVTRRSGILSSLCL